MKTAILKDILLLLVFAGITFSCMKENPEPDKKGNEDLIVLVKYKAQPEKESTAISAMIELIQEVRKEPNFVNIKLLIDLSDKSNILLYEQWSDEVYYKGAHMNTTHLQKFIDDSREFLTGPPDISFWKINSNFKID